MKRILLSGLTIFFLIAIPINIYADYENTIKYEKNDVTIIFQSDTPFSAEKQLYFVELLTSEDLNDEKISYNLLCSIFGHEYVIDNTVKITHKVRDSGERCLEEIYELGECSRCGDTYTDVISSYYINCCE